MPKCFQFHRLIEDEEGEVQGSARFRCYVKSVQCEARVTRGDRRCHNNTVVGLPYCYAHTMSKLKLLVKASPTAGHDGKGVFAHNVIAERGRVFKKGDDICRFFGETKTSAQIRRRYGSLDNVPYGIRLTQRIWVDSACVRSIGSLINHAPPSRANVKLRFQREDETTMSIIIVAKHDINHGTELLINWNWEDLQDWRTPRQEHHRTYDCKFSPTWDRKYEGL